MRSRFFLTCFFLLVSTAIDAADLPVSWTAGAELPSTPASTKQLESMDFEALAAEDAFNEGLGQPPRFALPHDVSISPLTSGQWMELADGTGVWRYRVQAGNAVSLNFGFRDVYLPEGAELFFYTPEAAKTGKPDRYQLIGPFGTDINEAHGQFWTPLLASSDVVIELNVPTSVRDQVSLELFRIGQGYRGFGLAADEYRQDSSTTGGEGKSSCDAKGAKSGSCNTDVACLGPDDPWNDPRRAVGAYSVGGSLACTGSLLNNTAENQRMLFVTATHCTVTSANAASVVVYWNYEWPSCRTPGDPTSSDTIPDDPNEPPVDPNSSQSGATFLAATIDPFDNATCLFAGDCSDMTLLELDDPADPEFNLFWAGWDRSSTPAQCGPSLNDSFTGNLCASIHHPRVDEKRITFVETDFVEADIAGAQGVHWQAFWDPTPPILAGLPFPQPGSLPPSVTEPGSSGSPLYNADRRLVGVLSGGRSQCGATGDDLSDQYGQLAHAWDGLGTPDTRMRDHLDPNNTNPLVLKGLEETLFEDGFEGAFGGAGPELDECRTYMPTQVNGSQIGEWSVINEKDTYTGLLQTPSDAGGGFWEVSLSAGGPIGPQLNVLGSNPDAGGVTMQAGGTREERSAKGAFAAYPDMSYTVEASDFNSANSNEYPFDYSLSYSFQSRVDCYEPNDVQEDAKWIPKNEPIEAYAIAGHGTGNVPVNEAKFDWYRFNASGPNLRVELQHVPSDISMGINLYKSGRDVPVASGFAGDGEPFTVVENNAEPGTYFIRVTRSSAADNVSGDTPIPDHWNTKYQFIVTEPD